MVHKKSEYQLNYKWIPVDFSQKTWANSVTYRRQRRVYDLSHQPLPWEGNGCECDEFEDESDKRLPLPKNRLKHRFLNELWSQQKDKIQDKDSPLGSLFPSWKRRVHPEVLINNNYPKKQDQDSPVKYSDSQSILGETQRDERPLQVNGHKLTCHQKERELEEKEHQIKQQQREMEKRREQMERELQMKRQQQEKEIESIKEQESELRTRRDEKERQLQFKKEQTERELQFKKENKEREIQLRKEEEERRYREELQRREGGENEEQSTALAGTSTPYYNRATQTFPVPRMDLCPEQRLATKSPKMRRLDVFPTRPSSPRPIVPPLLSYGWADSERSIGDKKTFNVQAATKDIHPSALRAWRRRDYDTQETEYRADQYKPRDLRHTYSRPPSSIWMTEYQRQYASDPRYMSRPASAPPSRLRDYDTIYHKCCV